MRVPVFRLLFISLATLVVAQKLPEKQFDDFVDHFKNLAARAIQAILPQSLSLIYEAEVSVDCLSSLLRLVRDAQQLEEWAIVMLDASVKVPVGVLDGSTFHIGEYDECLGISLESNSRFLFQGQYCNLEIRGPEFLKFPPEHRRELHNSSLIPTILAKNTVFRRFMRFHYGLSFLAFRLGICVPSTCDHNDLEAITMAALKETQLTAHVLDCQTKQSEVVLSEEHLVILTILAAALVLVVVGTLITWIFNFRAPEAKKPGIGENLLKAFCINHNTRQLLGQSQANEAQDPQDPERLFFLSGFRIVGLLVLIFGFSFGLPYLSFWHKLDRKANHLEIRKNLLFGIFGNVVLPFDTLLFSSGLLLAYRCLSGAKAKSSASSPFAQFFKIVFRCFCGNALAIGLFILFPLLSDGPLWKDLVIRNVDVCRRNAWRNFLFIQNFWPFEENCMFHTFLLTTIVLCAAVSTLILWLLTRNHVRLGICAGAAAILASCASASTINALERFPPAISLPVINGHTLFQMLSEDLIKPYTNLSAYTVGLFTGWLIAMDMTFKKMSTKLLAWSVTLGGLFLAYYIPYNFPYIGDTYRVLAALYTGSYRTIWCICLASFALLCHQNAGGFLGSILSSTMFIRLDRLTWSTYLVFPLIMFFYHGHSRQTIHMAYAEIFMHSFGFIVVSYLGGYVIHILFTAPAQNIRSLAQSYWQTRKVIQPIREAQTSQKLV